MEKNGKSKEELATRIKIVRRDMSDLLFHFTRRTDNKSARDVLNNILNEGKLKGTAKSNKSDKFICFTEAPIQECNSIFSLVSIATLPDHLPRYEPYGVAVSKKWLYEKGGRHVIYDHPDARNEISASQNYRFAPYSPLDGKDFTWEREWRIKSDELELDPNCTLVVVPTAKEAFEIVYSRSSIGIVGFDYDYDSDDWDDPTAAYICDAHEIQEHIPIWLAVSLDMFGLNIDISESADKKIG
jgi:hypothetical protein